MRKIFRTKEGKLAAIAMAFIIIVAGLIFTYNYVRKKDILEQAVMAENYLDAGKYEMAVEAYTRVLSMKGSDKQQLTIGLAEAYVGLEEFDKALEILRSFYMKSADLKIKESIEKISSKKTDYEYNQILSKAEVYFSNTEYEKAIEEFEKAKQIKRKNSASYKRIAEAYLLLGDYAKAREEIIEGQEITGDDKLKHTLALVNSYFYKDQYNMLLSQAAEYILQENYSEGEKKYQEAINLLPEQAPAYIGLADFYISQGRYDEAIRLLSGIYKYTDDQELIETYNRAKELKDVTEEKSNILRFLISSIKSRDINEVLTIMKTSFFVENVVDETDAYYFSTKNIPADSDDVKAGVDGVCLIVYDRNSIYYGDVKNSKRSGNGFYLTDSGKKYSYYDGEWKSNLPNGKGVYIQVEGYTDENGAEHENMIKIEGNYINALEEGNMTRFYYTDNKETSSLSYQAKGGTPLPVPGGSINPYPTLAGGFYIIGEIYVSGAPSGEYYSIKPNTVWGIPELMK